MKNSHSFLYVEIAESIRRRIAAGELQPGDKLPPVRDMARRWGCTPGTVSRAYTQLARDGLVEGRRGAGTCVLPNALQADRPTWQWVSLVNRAEQFLLEAIGSGHTPTQAESALSVAIARWQDLRREGVRQPEPEDGADVDRASGAAAGLRFAGSHDLAVERLSQMLTEGTPEVRLSVEYVGSLGGLMALAQAEADVAGAHLWDETTDTYNVSFVRRLLPGRRVALVTLAHRSLGLITPPGNPQGLRCLGDLACPDVCLVNRQSGSGTRVWLDAQLKAAGISPESVPGYDREELTHLAVARAIRDEEATVGLGIRAAASAYGLDFVPLTKERYDLVLPEGLWEAPGAQALIDVIRSPHFKEAIVELGGYDTSETGREVWVS